jgi:hypothetical protein
LCRGDPSPWPGRPGLTIGERRRQALEGQPPVSSGLMDGGPADDQGISQLRHLAPASWGHEMASSYSPACLAHTARPTANASTRTLVVGPPAGALGAGLGAFAWRMGALHPGRCRPGTGSRQRGRAPALTWCPCGCGRGISSRSSTATRTHGCGGMGPGTSGRPTWSWGTVGARTEAIQRSIADCPGNPMPW